MSLGRWMVRSGVGLSLAGLLLPGLMLAGLMLSGLLLSAATVAAQSGAPVALAPARPGAAAQSGAEEIVPLQAQVSYSGIVMQRPWTAEIRQGDGKARYQLTLEPTLWTNGQTASVTLVLRRAGESGASRGLQRVTFDAREMSAAGYQRQRVFSLAQCGFVLRTSIQRSQTRPGAGGKSVLESLKLIVAVEPIVVASPDTPDTLESAKQEELERAKSRARRGIYDKPQSAPKAAAQARP